MQVSQIISEIDKEIARLQEARRLLSGEGRATSNTTGRRGRRKTTSVSKPAKKSRGRRRLTPEGRKAISDALKARWAERKKAAAKKSK
jgi:hypothetical protein